MRGVTIGVLVIQTVERATFEPHDVDLFQTCAQLISPVVMNARLLSLVDESEEQIQRSAAELASHGIRVAGTPRPRADRNVEFRGIGTSRGIAIGPVYRMENPLDLAELEYAPRPSAEAEESDLLQAIQLVRRDLDDNREELGDRFGPDFSAVFHTHIQILEDKGFVAKLRKAVHETGNARTALRRGARRLPQDVRAHRGRLLPRAHDGRRGRRPARDGAAARRPPRAARCWRAARSWSPTTCCRATSRGSTSTAWRAIVSEHGGPTSHGAIFARTLEIPAVTGVPGLIAAMRPGELAIVDGGEGTRVPVARRAARRRVPARARALRDRGRAPRCAACAARRDARRPPDRAHRQLRARRATCASSSSTAPRASGCSAPRCSRSRTAASPRRRSRSSSTSASRRCSRRGPVTIRTLDLGGDKEVAEPRAAARGESAARLALDPALVHAARGVPGPAARDPARERRAATCGCCCR